MPPLDTPRVDPTLQGVTELVPMRLGIVYKLSLAMAVATACVLGGYGYLAIHREIALFDRSKREYGEVLGHALARQTAEAWRAGGRAAALEALRHFDQRDREIRIRWVSLTPAPAEAYDPRLGGTEGRELRAGRAVSFERAAWPDGTVSAHTYVPVPFDGAGAIEIVETLSDRGVYTSASVRRLLVTLGGSVALASLLAFSLSRWLVGRPIEALIQETRRIGRGGLLTHGRRHRRDEIGRLGLAIDEMERSLREARDRIAQEELARRETERQLRHAERLTTVGKLAAGVAHELGTPLNVIDGRAMRIVRAAPSEPTSIEADARTIRDQVERITRIIRQLLDFARRADSHPLDVDAADVLRGTEELLEAAIKMHPRASLEVVPGEQRLVVSVDPSNSSRCSRISS